MDISNEGLSQEDADWIEKFYSDLEIGFNSTGKVYTRPADYIQRALRIINAGNKRNTLLHQFEGKRGFYHEDN